MTKITKSTSMFNEDEALYALPYMSGQTTRGYLSQPLPMNDKQRETMTQTCRSEAAIWSGYDPVPMEALRNDPSIHQLLDMLEVCRPGGGPDEETFIETYLVPLAPLRDEYGNSMIEVPVPEGHPRILWSCHTDTVHRHGGTQKVEVTSGVAWTSDGSCLGSDDTVGVWLALEMIKARVPGVYIFHRDEESGGLGSSWLAKEAADFIATFDCAIALDRADYADVITHQAGGRCCSDAFAASIAEQLGGRFKACDGGVFTDTANYVDLIGECTNLSVGYFKQHGPMEHTNLSFASNLRDALVKADWTKLVFVRKPGEVEYLNRWGNYDDKWGTYTPRKQGTGAAYGSHTDKLDAMEEFVREFPWVVAEYLLEMGIEIEDLDLYEPGDLEKGGR